jgi:hypothetical protein
MEFWQQLLIAEETARIKGQQTVKAQVLQPQQVIRQENANVHYRTALDYDSSGNAIYIGEADTGASKQSPSWRIKHLTYDTSNNITDIRWAGGDQKFNKIWNDRTGYTYS